MKAKLAVGIGLGTLTLAWIVFSWFEAGTEIRVLCSQFRAGMSRAEVVSVLETGEYLRYRGDTGANEAIFIDSLYGLGSTRCVVVFEGGRVASSDLR